MGTNLLPEDAYNQLLLSLLCRSDHVQYVMSRSVGIRRGMLWQDIVSHGRTNPALWLGPAGWRALTRSGMITGLSRRVLLSIIVRTVELLYLGVYTGTFGGRRIRFPRDYQKRTFVVPRSANTRAYSSPVLETKSKSASPPLNGSQSRWVTIVVVTDQSSRTRLVPDQAR